MLVELRDVEVYVEPDDILIKALEEGELRTDNVVNICINEDSADEVLSAVDNEDIKYYCALHDLLKEDVTYENILSSLALLTNTEKARLLWELLHPTNTVVTDA